MGFGITLVVSTFVKQTVHQIWILAYKILFSCKSCLWIKFRVLFQFPGTATVQDYSTLAFLYGTVPSAPGVFVYATSYNLDVELIASAMVACTFLSAPIMFVSARLISLATIQPKDYQEVLGKFNTDICVVSLFACVSSTFMFIHTMSCKGSVDDQAFYFTHFNTIGIMVLFILSRQ